MRSYVIHALVVLIAGLLLGSALLLSGAFQGMPRFPSLLAEAPASRPLLACGQTTQVRGEGRLPCMTRTPQIPPPPGGLGACDAETDCLSLRELLGAWTAALAVLVGSLGTLWVVEGCVAALRPGQRESVWAAMLNRVLTVGLVYYVAWRIDDFAQFVLDVLVAHKADAIQPLASLGHPIGGGPPTALLVDFLGQLLVFLSQCFLVFFAPRVLVQTAATIGALLWAPAREHGRVGHHAVAELIGIIGLGVWLLFAPSLLGGLLNLLSGALSS